MANVPIVKRRRGRPHKEESVAIAMDKAILDMRSGIADLVPEAMKTLKSLLSSGTEKVKEGTAKFILQEAKEIQASYIVEDNEREPETAEGLESAKKADVMPLTTAIREYPKVSGDDE